MKVYVTNNKKIEKYNFPSKVEDFFSVNYYVESKKTNFVITFEGRDDKWYLKTNGNVNIVSSNQIVEEAEIKEYGVYNIKLLGVNELTLLYVMPTQEDVLYSLDYETTSKITIGNSQNCNIYYRSNILSELHATIEKKENVWILTKNSNNNIEVYVNDRTVTTHALKYGDIIFISGLKIIWLPNFFKINNPNKMIYVSGIKAYTTSTGSDNEHTDPVSDEESVVELYKEDDYFYHIPILKETVEAEGLLIDSPPGNQLKSTLPFWLTIGSILTMSASCVMMGFNVYNNWMNYRSILKILPQLIMMSAMLIGSFLMPKITQKYQKNQAKKREKLRQDKYGEYLDKKKVEIQDFNKHQADVMNTNYPSAFECTKIISNQESVFWSREIDDGDFLRVKLGNGTVPSLLKISAPEEHFSLDSDNLFDMVYKLVDESKEISNVPITYSFLKNRITSFVFNCTYKTDYINSILLQILAFHSSMDLKIVILTNKTNEKDWEYTKVLPHCWNDEKNVRFFATNEQELNEVSSYLSGLYRARLEAIESNENAALYYPYYLIITDDYMKVKNSQLVLDIVNNNVNAGFSLMALSNSIRTLPNQSNKFLEICEKNSVILDKKVSKKSQIKFNNEYVQNLDMKKYSTIMSNIPLATKDGKKELPTTLTFLEMFGVSKVEQLNILSRWQNNNPVTSLATPVGVHEDLELFKLDLHEKFHGPHGLIAGSTGSGKSEFIITYILSLALNYHPYEVQFVLIDYKGGGLAGAFENKETGVKLPHLVGTITNLDTSEMNRTLVSIDSELKRRQRIFNETKDMLGESTIDIYKYQKLYREGRVKKPLAHLFIISDEFAELKSQQPDFMNQLISTARIGRSLGVHLILATQKPSGVVNDQIWSNSKFKVCLKVQDRGDSMEMLKRPEAASIKDAGRFYLQVGYNDYFALGQSGWCGAKYVPSNKIIKKFDDSIQFVNNNGYVIKSINDEIKADDSVDYGDQLTNIVKYISNLSKKENLVVNQMWKEKLPAMIYVDKLKEKYQVKTNPYVINPVIGEYDSPATQTQGVLTLDLTNKGNTIIWGQAGSGKENLLTTMLWSISTEHSPEEINLYIIDCGAEILKMFYKTPHVGEVVTIDEGEKINEIFEMVNDELERRKQLFADYVGSYTNYIENSGEKLPLIVIVINGYENFSETHRKMSEAIQSFYRDCKKYGVVFVLSAITTNSISGRLTQYFENKICLQLPNDSSYRDLLNCPRSLIPANEFGRGVVEYNDNYYEFQTANVIDQKRINNVIQEASKKLNEMYPVGAPKIKIIPNIVGLNMVKNSIIDLAKVPLGINMETKDIQTYNFLSQSIHTILSGEMSREMDFVYGFAREISMIPKTKVNVIDFVNAFEKQIPNVEVFNDNFDNTFINISNSLRNDKTSPEKNVYILIAPGAMKSRLSEKGLAIVNNMFLNSSILENNIFILIDDYDNIRNLRFEEWYQSQVSNSSGIWLGLGIDVQMAINISNLTLDDRKLDFPYITFSVVNGKRSIVKHILDEEIIIDEQQEENSESTDDSSEMEELMI